MDMTVSEFLFLCIDPSMMTVEIWSDKAKAVLWTGPGDEIPDEYEYSELWSFDPPVKAGWITLNVE